MKVIFEGHSYEADEIVSGFYYEYFDPLRNKQHCFIMRFLGIESGEPIFDTQEVIPDTVKIRLN